MPVHSSKALHHWHIRKRVHDKYEPYPHPDRVKRFFDKLIYVAAFIGPVMNIPQLLEIWLNKSAAGVSFISWSSFAMISVMWFIYGLLHQEKPIIFMNGMLIILQSAIAVGALIYG